MSQSNDRFATGEAPYQVQNPNAVPVKKSGCGCWIMGCLGVMLFALVCTGVMSFLGYRYINSQIVKYTEETPVQLPAVEYDEDQMAELNQRLDNFKQEVNVGQESAEISLTADEINALINSSPDSKGIAFVNLDNDVLTCDVSIPLKGVLFSGGRYLNGSATVDIRKENGKLQLNVLDITVKGEKIPDAIMTQLRQQNFAEELEKNKDAKELFDRVEEMRIEDGKLIMRVKADFQKPQDRDSTGDLQ